LARPLSHAPVLDAPHTTPEVLTQVSTDLLDASEAIMDVNHRVAVFAGAASGFVVAVSMKDKSAKEAARTRPFSTGEKRIILLPTCAHHGQ
jgi:hypothetical protein